MPGACRARKRSGGTVIDLLSVLYSDLHALRAGDATVRVWDAATLKLVAVLRGHRGSVLCLLGLGPNLLLSGARDNTIR